MRRQRANTEQRSNEDAGSCRWYSGSEPCGPAHRAGRDRRVYGTHLDAKYRVDLIVEDLVVVEVKSVVDMNPVYHAQALTYMKLTNCPAGLVINFNVPRLMDGVKRLMLPDRVVKDLRERVHREHEETE